MTNLRELAQPDIDAAARLTPSIAELQARVHGRRRRRRVLIGGLGAVGLVSAGLLASSPHDEDRSDIASLGWEEDASVPADRLPPTSGEVTVANVTPTDDEEDLHWDLVAYRASATADGTERVCSEFQARPYDADEDAPPVRRGPQSCFPVPGGDRGAAWMFIEIVGGQSVLVVAQPQSDSTPVMLDGEATSGANLAPHLPVRFSIATLRHAGHMLTIGPSTVEVSPITGGANYAPGDGTRELRAFPATEGMFFERLTTDNPADDGWVQVVGDGLDGVGYLNPVDMLIAALPPDAGPNGPEHAQPAPAPVYDAEGKRIGWWTCGYSRDRRSTCGNTTTSIG